MSEHEAYINSYLNDFMNEQNTVMENRRKLAEDWNFKNFQAFDKGDRVSMTLAGVAFNNTFAHRLVRVEAILNDPQIALIDVKLTDGLEEWEGKTIGLGVCAELPQKGVPRLYSRVVAGTWDAAYYLPEDIEFDDLGRPHIDNDKLRLLGLKYARILVGGSPLVVPRPV